MKLILGYGKTGESIARFFTKKGEIKGDDFFIYDDQNPCEIRPYDIVFKSSGVPLTHPLCLNKKVMTELDLFRPKARVIAVTGTSGKTTITTLIYEFLKYNHVEVVIGGNIGTPVLDLPELSKNGIYVLELSSFQLETAPNLPIDIAIWLNLMPNHLDRHETMENYYQAKFNIFKHAKQAIICEHFQNVPSPTIPFLMAKQNPASILERVAEILNLPKEGIEHVISQFKGIEHRLEVIPTKHEHVTFVNDSKATTFFAVAYAIEKYKDQGDIHLIMGGMLKESDPSYLGPFLKYVSKFYIFGKERQKIQNLLNPFKSSEIFETLQDVMAHLKIDFQNKTIVLFSPGGTSYDLYKIYSERGDDFKKQVLKI